MKILNIDDNIYKKMAIKRALDEICNAEIKWAMDMNDALKTMKAEKESGTPFDVIITDMNYPLRTGDPSNGRAGVLLIQKLREMKDTTPVILCSSINYQLSEPDGCVYYSDTRILSADFRDAFKKIGLIQA